MMYNDEFQITINEGDILLTDSDNSVRFERDEEYEFIDFVHCRHAETIIGDGGCVNCIGKVEYLDLTRKRKTIDCLREYEDGIPHNKLIIMAEIIYSKWLEEDDFLI